MTFKVLRPITPTRVRATSVLMMGAFAALSYPAIAAAQETPSPGSPGQSAASENEKPSAAPAAARTRPVKDSDASDIVVTGERPTVTTSIDRKSYSLNKDIQATTGSAADVLRNIPSITVDLDGNPSLRGDSKVQILIDGRPAPDLNSANRGATLQQLGADTIDHVEVMTNPPANFKPDGSAGIINIVTKKRTAGRTASLQANGGSSGRYNVGGNASAQFGKLNVHGGLTVRRDLRSRFVTDDRTVTDPATGAFRSANGLSSTGRMDRVSKTATLGADLALSKADKVSAEGTYSNRVENSTYGETDFVTDAAGTTTRLSGRDRPGRLHRISSSAQLRYQHNLGTDGSNVSIFGQRSQVIEHERYDYANSFALPASAPTFQAQRMDFDEVTRELGIDYTQMLPGKAKLILGYNLQRDDNLFDNRQTIPQVNAPGSTLDPNFTNVFKHGQTVQAWYGTYQRPIGSLTVLAGARLEQTNIQINQVTSGQTGRQSYFRVYPTLSLTDKIAANQTLKASFGVRVIRPESDDLNPYPVQSDAFTIRRGNPYLRPQEIRSLELGWSYEKGSVSRSATLFYRDIRNGFTNVTTVLDPTTVLITQQNLGRSQSGGLELVTAGKLLSKLTYTLSGNVYYNRIDASNLGYVTPRSTFSFDAKAALNYSVTAKDTAQFNVNGMGKRLTPQGYREGYVTVDWGYRHQLRPNLALTATVSDLFASRRDNIVITTPGLYDVQSRRQTGRIAFIGLSWNLPGAKKKADKFDYER